MTDRPFVEHSEVGVAAPSCSIFFRIWYPQAPGIPQLRTTAIDPTIAEHRGHIVKNTGDGLLVEFASAVDAVQCAIKFRRTLGERYADVPDVRIMGAVVAEL